jgi:hypothetical protein
MVACESKTPHVQVVRDRKRWRGLQSLGVLLLLGLAWSCKAQLAPAFDKSIVDGLTAANVEAMELFASVSAGSDKADFPDREDKYNAVIGAFDALAIQAGARPIPDSKVRDAVNSVLEKKGIAVLNGDAPSVEPLKLVSKTVTKMRDTDKKQGVTATEAAAFKGVAAISIDQALTYEKFLER